MSIKRKSSLFNFSIFKYALLFLIIFSIFGFTKKLFFNKKQKPTVLILPAYDLNANGGFSPEIQDILEAKFKTNSEIELIKFPFKKLKQISYQNVYDKKYCTPILGAVKVDFIIMSKIDLKDILQQIKKWDLSFKIYNVKANQQIGSKLKYNDLSYVQIEDKIQKNYDILIDEILEFKN